MIKEDFKHISFRGRVAFGICCFENFLINLKYDTNEWKLVLEFLWEATNSYNLERSITICAEIIPECVLEFEDYKKHEYEYLQEDDFKYLYELYKNIDGRIDDFMELISNLEASHAYSSIVGYGNSSLNTLMRIIDYMELNKIPLPDIEAFRKHSIDENKGWGNLNENLLKNK